MKGRRTKVQMMNSAHTGFSTLFTIMPSGTCSKNALVTSS